MNSLKETTSVERAQSNVPRCCSSLIGRRVKRLKIFTVAVLLGALLLVSTGLATNWGWLVAVGAAPVLVALLPCVFMCMIGIGAIVGLGGADVAEKDKPKSATRVRAYRGKRIP